MEQYVITISRQFGSMGRSIARELSEILGIEFLDRDIVEATAKRMGLPVSVISDEEESMKSTFFRRQYPLGMGMSSLKDEIFLTQKNIIRDFAAKGSCIIVGRAADYILYQEEDLEGLIRIFVYADDVRRVERVMEVDCIDEVRAKKRIKKIDKERKDFYFYFTGEDWQNVKNYDLPINTTNFDLDETVELIKEYIRLKGYEL